MDYNKGVRAISQNAKAFRDRYRSPFGQMILRLDDEAYLMSRENLKLSKVTENDVKEYDINTGDIGAILRALPDVNAIVFAVTEEMTVCSSKGEALKPALDDFAMLIGTDAPVLENATAKNIAKALQNRGGCLIKGSGAFGVGSNLPEAVAAVQIIQKACEVEVLGSSIGEIHYLDPAVSAKLRANFENSYSIANKEEFVNYIGHNETEFDLRNALIEAGKQMADDSLVHGCWGNLSVRLNDEEMLISPSGMDYFDIRIEDIVRTSIETLEYGDQRKPSTESQLHAWMYKFLPDCGAIIHTHSNALCVLSALHAGFKIEDENLQKLIGDVLVSEYAPSGSTDLAKNALRSMLNTHAIIQPNHGALFYGPSLDVVLAIANAVEARAANLIGYKKVAVEEEE
ncbi:MAG: class II aldolase/adducin family protein [Firmicutes bacterium]|nr:class II aldolase/adducin family protein [Bacillota bacterium]